MWSRNKINSVLATIYFISAPSVYLVLAPNYANDVKTFLKHFSDCLFYFCSTCADCITVTFSPTLLASVSLYCAVSANFFCTQPVPEVSFVIVIILCNTCIHLGLLPMMMICDLRLQCYYITVKIGV